jgi:hypothetical protein
MNIPPPYMQIKIKEVSQSQNMVTNIKKKNSFSITKNTSSFLLLKLTQFKNILVAESAKLEMAHQEEIH